MGTNSTDGNTGKAAWPSVAAPTSPSNVHKSSLTYGTQENIPESLRTPYEAKLDRDQRQGKGHTDSEDHKHACQQTPPSVMEVVACTPRSMPQKPGIEPISCQVMQYLMAAFSVDSDIPLCFEEATSEPPITQQSLSELDMARIINNSKLRHDVNFDRELHFRPNLDGSRGQHKILAADKYWRALEGELYICNLAQKKRTETRCPKEAVHWDRVMACGLKRLPILFESIKQIMKTLVPDADQPSIEEKLDVELIMQEIRNGVCDLLEMAQWFTVVLKNHCAPMRDAMIDQMAALVNEGVKTDTQSLIVAGLRELLAILEAMKLDVANHQIRHMRCLLIDDTLQFQQRYHGHRIENKRIDVPRARAWLVAEIKLLTVDEAPGHLEALTSGSLRALITQNGLSNLPQTFYLDVDRLRALSVDIHTQLSSKICGDIFTELAVSSLDGAKCEMGRTELVGKLSKIIDVPGQYLPHVEYIALELVRVLLSLQGSDEEYDRDLVSQAEQRLREELQPSSTAFVQRAKAFEDDLRPTLLASVQRHVRLSTMGLHETLVPPTSIPLPQNDLGALLEGLSTTSKDDSVTDILRRFTHIVVLHWQVWAELVYLVPREPQLPPSPAHPEDMSQSPPEDVQSPQSHHSHESKPVIIEETDLPTPPATPPNEEDAPDATLELGSENPRPPLVTDPDTPPQAPT